MNKRFFSYNVVRISKNEQIKSLYKKVESAIRSIKKKEIIDKNSKNKKVQYHSVKADKLSVILINKLEKIPRVLLGFSMLSVVFFGSYRNYLSRETSKMYADMSFILSTAFNFSTVSRIFYIDLFY